MHRSPSTDRRQLLRLAAAAAGTLWLPRSAWSQTRLSANPFTLGVASGSPLHDSVVLWTRLASAGLFGTSNLPEAPITVRWELAHDEAFARIAQKGQTQALPELGHSVHVEVGGLEGGSNYFYRFMLGGEAHDWVSAIGRTRTLPAPDAKPATLRLAYASCQRWEHGYFSAWRHLAAERPDAVVFLGDYIYEFPGSANAVRPGTGAWALTLDDYRKRYAIYKADADLQAAHAACPWFVVWDDHEVQNDYAGLTPGESGPRAADFAARRAAAYQAFYEHMPLRASVLTRALAGLASGAEMRIYGQARFGQLATLHLLDARQHRSPLVCTRDGKLGSSTVNPANCANWMDPARTMLGAEQERWLGDSLGRGAGEGGWSLIGQSTLFGPRDFRPGPGQTLWNDGWDGYSPARQRLIDTLRKQRVANPVLLGGDVHENWVGHVLADFADPASAPIGVEFCGTSISSRSEGNAKTAERLAENPHFVFADAERKGYGIVDIAAQQMNVSLRVVSDVSAKDAQVSTLAKFVVQAGTAKVYGG
ncbi:MAG: alkaline phosphatase D family protein [Pseudomonadota bacterium]